jgi:putative membrane protein
VLLVLYARTDGPAIIAILATGGAPLLWLLPYRTIFFLLYASGWFLLLRPYDPERRAKLAYLFWVTSIREAVDRLLPVASVGGGVVGIRLLHWRGFAPAEVGATVIAEIVLTLIAAYGFTALGLALLAGLGSTDSGYRLALLALTLSLPVPLATFALLRHGALLALAQRFFLPLIGMSDASAGAVQLDRALRDTLRRPDLWAVGALQFAGLLSASFEVWLALRLFGHPVDAASAVALESLIQAVRHVAFMIPAGVGVQEAGLVLFGHLVGIGAESGLALALVKRMRETLWGILSLGSWQWMEGRRLTGRIQI